jgi:hypothetical protein
MSYEDEFGRGEPTTAQPVQRFRIGLLEAALWQNTSENNRVFYNVTIHRSFQDREGEWKTTGSFNHTDLLNVARLAERAESWISSRLNGRQTEQNSVNSPRMSRGSGARMPANTDFTDFTDLAEDVSDVPF